MSSSRNLGPKLKIKNKTPQTEPILRVSTSAQLRASSYFLSNLMENTYGHIVRVIFFPILSA